MCQQVNDVISRSCGHTENVGPNEPLMPSRGRAPSMQLSEDSVDRPPSSDFVTRAEHRAHFVTVQTLFLQLKDNISSMLQPNQGNSQHIIQPCAWSLLVWFHKIHSRFLLTILVLIIPKLVHCLNCKPTRQIRFNPICPIFCLPPSVFQGLRIECTSFCVPSMEQHASETVLSDQFADSTFCCRRIWINYKKVCLLKLIRPALSVLKCRES